MSKGDLIRRFGVAAIGIPLALLVLMVGGWLLTLFVAGLAALATLELFTLASARGIRVFSCLGTVGTVVLVLLAGWTQSFLLWAPWALGSLIFLFFLSSVAALKLRAPEDRPLLASSVTVMSALYWGGCFSFAVFLRHFPELGGWPPTALANRGAVILAFPLAVTWTADTAAYLFGSLYGKRKMIPHVSPGKTVEGGVASLLTAVLVGAFMGWVFLRIHPDAVMAGLLGGAMGFALGITTQLGDLIESLFKREAGVKDSGSLLPGHGGILDRFDALIFTLPFAYGLIYLVGILQ